MKNYLIKNLTAVTIIICTVGIVDVWAEEFKSKLPKCKGEYSSSWNNCYGAFNQENGDNYVGEFKNGKYDGQGMYTNVMGDVYKGNFENGEMNGYGTKTYKLKIDIKSIDGRTNKKENNKDIFVSGFKYSGNFNNGKRNGRGIGVSQDKKIYFDGFWFNDKFTYSKKDEELDKKLEINEIASVRNRINNKLTNCVGEYSMQWNNCFGKWYGEINFAGELFNNEKQEKYIGQFKNGLKHGKGVFINKKGEEYIGEWKEDLKNGEGIETISGGLINAIWVNGKKNGKAKLTEKDDKASVGYLNYEDDELHGEQIYNFKHNELMIVNYSYVIQDVLMYAKT